MIVSAEWPSPVFMWSNEIGVSIVSRAGSGSESFENGGAIRTIWEPGLGLRFDSGVCLIMTRGSVNWYMCFGFNCVIKFKVWGCFYGGWLIGRKYHNRCASWAHIQSYFNYKVGQQLTDLSTTHIKQYSFLYDGSWYLTITFLFWHSSKRHTKLIVQHLWQVSMKKKIV